MAKDPLKEEWDKKKGFLTRKCRICGGEFQVKHWKQTICENDFCKQGSFRKAHFNASKKRWEGWLKEAKAKGIKFE